MHQPLKPTSWRVWANGSAPYHQPPHTPPKAKVNMSMNMKWISSTIQYQLAITSRYSPASPAGAGFFFQTQCVRDSFLSIRFHSLSTNEWRSTDERRNGRIKHLSNRRIIRQLLIRFYSVDLLAELFYTGQTLRTFASIRLIGRRLQIAFRTFERFSPLIGY